MLKSRCLRNGLYAIWNETSPLQPNPFECGSFLAGGYLIKSGSCSNISPIILRRVHSEDKGPANSITLETEIVKFYNLGLLFYKRLGFIIKHKTSEELPLFILVLILFKIERLNQSYQQMGGWLDQMVNGYFWAGVGVKHLIVLIKYNNDRKNAHCKLLILNESLSF